MIAQESMAGVYRPRNNLELIRAVNAANFAGNFDVIDLQGQTFVFSVPCNDASYGADACSTADDALPPILSTIAVNPAGKLSIINGSIVRMATSGNPPVANPAFRLIELEQDAGLILHNITLEYGLAQNESSPPDEGNYGGAIYNKGCLTLQNTTISNNTANDSGGGIYNAYTATLDIQSSNISNNVANAVSSNIDGSYAGGGGIFNEFKYIDSNKILGLIVSIDNTNISKNITLGYGAGINNQGTANNIFSSTISYNYCCNSVFVGVCPVDSLSGGGGGIYNDGSSGNLQIFNSTIAYNQAYQGGGLLNNWSPSDTLFFDSSAVVIYNSTIAKNTAAQGGGGIYNSNNTNNPNPMYTSPNNVAIIANLVSTIVADNIDEDLLTPDIQNFEYPVGLYTPAMINSHNHNLIGNNQGVAQTIYMNDGFFDKAGTNASPLNPLLARLRRNGGFTQTIELYPGSPAINSGSNPNNYLYDQREQPYQRSACDITDIGAYELQDCFSN